MAQAIAYDILNHTDTTTITLLDNSQKTLTQARTFLKPQTVETIQADINNTTQLNPLFRQSDIIISAAHYHFNYHLAQLAIKTHSHFIDLGGNNNIVAQQKTLHTQAQKANVTIIPDNGLAPGLVSIITHDIVNTFDTIDTVHIRVGGIPQHPQLPLKYQLVFSIDGLINEYAEPALILNRGIITEKPSLTELETIQFPPPYNQMEAFLTSGGCSTLPYTYQKKIGYLDYKTIRYPGHCAKIYPLFELGLASTQSITLNNTTIKPRSVLKKLLQKHIPTTGKDAVLLQIQTTGTINQKQHTRIYQIIDHYDTINDITAMQRMTGYPVAITAQMILTQQIIKTGVYCPEEIIPPDSMFTELQKRNINLEIKTQGKKPHDL